MLWGTRLGQAWYFLARVGYWLIWVARGRGAAGWEEGRGLTRRVSLTLNHSESDGYFRWDFESLGE